MATSAKKTYTIGKNTKTKGWQILNKSGKVIGYSATRKKAASAIRSKQAGKRTALS